MDVLTPPLLFLSASSSTWEMAPLHTHTQSGFQFTCRWARGGWWSAWLIEGHSRWVLVQGPGVVAQVRS